MANIRTWKALAAVENVPVDRVCVWRRRDDWPLSAKIPKNGFTKANLKKLKDWRDGLQDDRSATARNGEAPVGDPALVDIQKQKQREDMLYRRLTREILEGKYILVELHEAAVRGVAETFVGEINKALQKLPTVLVGLEPGEIESQLNIAFTEMRQAIHDRKSIEITRSAEAMAGKNKNPVGRPGV